MTNEILETFLRAHPDGVGAEAIGREVMLLKGPAAVIERIASAALARTEGVVRDAQGLYRWVEPVRVAPPPPASVAPAPPPGAAPSSPRTPPPALAWSDDFRARNLHEGPVEIEPWVAPPEEAPPLLGAPPEEDDDDDPDGVDPELADAEEDAADVDALDEAASAPAGERVVALVARTTGRDPSVDVLLEVGAIELVDGSPSGHGVCGHVRPPRPLPRQVLEAAGIEVAALREGIDLDEMLNLLAALLDGARIVCLGTERGASFLEAALRRSGREVAFEGVVVLWPLLQQAGLVSGRVGLDAAATALGVLAPDGGDAATLAATLAEVTAAALERGVALSERAAPPPFDFSRVNFDRAVLDALPETPGIYRFLDRQRRVLYVGKARRLRQRVASYFAHRSERRQRHDALVERLWDLQWEETGSELGALLAELREIRRHKPPINVQLQVRHRRKLTGSHVLFLPGADAGAVDLLFVRDGNLVGQGATDRHGRDMTLVRKALLRAFFTALPPREPDPAESALVASWLRQHGESQSVLDLSQVGSLDEATRIVRAFVTDPELFRERLIHR